MYESFSEEILTVEEFAELLYIGKNTAYKILNSGEIRAFKIGKAWKIPKDAVSEYILRKSKRNLSKDWNMDFVYHLLLKILHEIFILYRAE